MPIDNDYFKNRQQQNKGSNNGSNNIAVEEMEVDTNHLFNHLKYSKALISNQGYFMQ